MIYIDIHYRDAVLDPNKFHNYDIFTIETNRLNWDVIEKLIQEFLSTFDYVKFKLYKIEIWHDDDEEATRIYFPEEIEKWSNLNKCKSIW